MAGVKGRSGGARPNTGGARPGSGRKPAPKTNDIGAVLAEAVVNQAPVKVSVPAMLAHMEAVASTELTPLEFMLSVMRNPMVDDKLRLEAAKTAATYCHLKKGDGGIKDEKAEKAKKAGQGKFAAAPAPLRMIK
jgi:phage terminase small subunit